MGSLEINSEKASAAAHQFKKHADGAVEIQKAMKRSLNDFGLGLGAHGITCASFLESLTTSIHDLIDQCAKDAKVADGGGTPDYSVADGLMNGLDSRVASAPPVAHGTTPITVHHDELLPDLKAGDYYKDRATDADPNNDSLWGADGIPSTDDINQGGLGDCWVLAPLLSAIAVNPNLVDDLITDNGDGTYTVHLDTGDVEVDGRVLAVTNSGNSKGVAIIELAYAQSAGGSYEDIDGGHADDAMDDIFGLDSDSFDPDKTRFFGNKNPEDSFDEIEAAINKGLPVTLSANEAVGFGGGHALAVTGVTYVNGERCIEVRNPWGPNNASANKTFSNWTTTYGGSIDPNDPSVIRLPADVAADIFRGATVAG